MKKIIYLLSLGFLVSSINVEGQISKTKLPSKKNNAVEEKSPVQNLGFQKDFDNPIWEDDFSDPTTWEIGNLADNTDDWVIGFDVPSGDFPIAQIQSTTADNGYALFDSDLYCSSSQNAWIKNATPINLTDYDFVSIQFETFYRQFQGSCFVETSIDNENWTSIEILTDLAVNAATANPAVIQLPLPNNIGGESEVWFRFRYVGACDYAWMIDDVKIAERPSFDISFENAYFDEHILISQDETFLDTDYIPELEYSSYQQGLVRPFTFVADVSNQGIETLTDVVFTASVTTPDGVETFSNSLAALAPGERTFITIPDVVLDAFSDGGVLGEYTVDFAIEIAEVEEEPELGNNFAASKSFMVHEELMANDRGNNWNGSFYGIEETVIYGSRFANETAADVNFIQFAIINTAAAPSVEGEVIYLNVRTGSVFDEGTPELLFGETEIDYTMEGDAFTTASGANAVNWITVFFPEPVTIDANTVYQGEVQAFMFDTLPVAHVPVAIMQELYSGTLAEVVSGETTWFTLGSNNPMIRLGYSDAVGTNGPSDLEFKLGQNYPNPTNGNTRIDWELLTPASNVQFAVTDVTGKTVYAKDLGDRPAGVQEPIELDLNLASGNYQYSLTIGNQRIVRKMMVAK